ncbi:MAG TPA: FKBP-type peptidyl-prolyl cis-trans isomerase [Candidatus Thiothrix moscowensis]|uniref:FKBP-type peptidyl-prolyl cis-trans isomerase n=2 Tax=Thiothrix TaxID=1030 RepID=UPI0025CFA854|nr:MULTISPECIES: FKBP-type peptidyl-prolyl cis-trans isomerase [unclassified Thiothrix]HRJ51362.1 FKBP-type peptidyl-prolyl cis-trans isomerase [Candidatus Thiothrix moscowensis]HRJ91583.1 FKBP-type peptidyl-prolyl cis-trans isomerase [Candidatus Thiothrix moscowensis]
MKASFFPLALALSASLLATACNDKAATTPQDAKPATRSTTQEAKPMAGLQITDVKVGEGTEATAGKMVSVHYTGWLYDENAPDKHGAKFDSSRDRGQPFQFPLAGGRVIKGWDEGVQGMKIGGQRTLVIPPEMGYGARGAGGVIPPNATLVFDVELLGVQ